MENQQNKSRIPRKLNPAAPIVSSIPPPNIKEINVQQGKLRQPSTFGQVKSRGIAAAAITSNNVSRLPSKAGQKKEQTKISAATKTPNITHLIWSPSGSRRNPNTNRTVKRNVEAYRSSSTAKPAIKKSTTTAQEKIKRLAKVPPSILRREDLMNDEKLVASIPLIKRKSKDSPASRNVRRREALTTDKLNVLRDQNAHIKADLSAAQITKAVTIADKTSLEIEKERLKREHNIKFGEICQLEHVLACEQSKVANLLEQIAKQRSDYLLMAQEKDNLVKDRVELEGKNNEADKELDELAKVLAISGAELKEVTARLDEKLHVNADLKSSVDKLSSASVLH